MDIAILTISDTAARDAQADLSGPRIAEWAQAHGHQVTLRTIVPDETGAIVRELLRVCDGHVAGVIVTTGGTGMSPRDVTPEATRAVIEREAPGIAEYVRTTVTPTFPKAALSRGIAGIRGTTLIVNLPGSPNAVRDGLRVLDAVVVHAYDVLTGIVTSHGR